MSQFNLTILLYHGVTNSIPYGIENISGKHISVDEYFDQMSWLKKNANILSMEEVYYFIANKIHFLVFNRYVIFNFDLFLYDFNTFYP